MSVTTGPNGLLAPAEIERRAVLIGKHRGILGFPNPIDRALAGTIRSIPIESSSCRKIGRTGLSMSSFSRYASKFATR